MGKTVRPFFIVYVIFVVCLAYFIPLAYKEGVKVGYAAGTSEMRARERKCREILTKASILSNHSTITRMLKDGRHGGQRKVIPSKIKS
jgi:hypothetical protein